MGLVLSSLFSSVLTPAPPGVSQSLLTTLRELPYINLGIERVRVRGQTQIQEPRVLAGVPVGRKARGSMMPADLLLLSCTPLPPYPCPFSDTAVSAGVPGREGVEAEL